MLLPNPLFSRLAVCSLGEVAYYSDCSSIHSSDCSNCFAILGPGSGSDYDSGRCCPHADPITDSG